MDPDQVLAMADERFERRLTHESAAIRQEIGALRQEVASLGQRMATRDDLVAMATRDDLAAVRQQMATRDDLAAVRQQMATRDDLAAVRQELAALPTRGEFDGLRREMADGFMRLEHQIAESRAELIKWSFMFWTGQCLALVGFLLVILRVR